MKAQTTCLIIYSCLILLLLAGCQTAPRQVDYVQLRRERILACILKLKHNEIPPEGSFEYCRQVYQLRLVGSEK